MNKPTIKPLPKSNNLPAMEEEVLQFWNETKAFEKSVEMRPKDKQYVFYDGPPFATGMPHYGHLLGSTSKDVIPRYWTMKGYRVERIWGWDCHGLPIEHMIEKQLNIQGGKKGIEALGIDKFNAACRAEVLRLDKEWEKIIGRLGRWVDFKNNYKTMDTTYMESVWWGFKELNEKGLVYEGKKVILYCPRCATPLSNFEIAMDNSYREVTEPSNVYKYKLKNAGGAGKGTGNSNENTYLLAWSTTPWNKLATPALSVNPDLKYVKVKQGDEFYILAESTLKILTDAPYEVVETYQGSQLEQFEFELHYDFYPRAEGERAGVIVADPFVTAEEGTGVVTLAVYGEDDYRVMKEQNIQMVEHVDDEGRLRPEVKPWAGMTILDVNSNVNEDLAERGLIYREDPHTHSVAECYRCGTRLYYAPQPAWFIDVQKLKPELLAQNEFMNWFPAHLKHGRFGKGLETAPDWNISRSRYWGTPMPIWRAAKQVSSHDKITSGEDAQGNKTLKIKNTLTVDKYKRVISSLEELKKWAVNPEEVENLTDIHREFLDKIQVWVDDERTIPGFRVKEVFDCWVESGSMPFAARHYPFENKAEFEASYPAQFVSEYIAQTRAWFYTMHVMSVGVFGKLAVENTLTTGTVLAEDGSKMSKSKKNYPDPMEVINDVGSDSLRLYLMSSPVMKGENLNFSETEVNDIRKKVFLIWWNMVSFYKLNAGETAVDLTREPQPTTKMDRWVWSRLGTVTGEVTTAMDTYDVVKASRLIMQFVTDLSTWYVRRSRDQMRDGQGKADSLHLYGTVLVRLAQLAAPFTPFFSEFVWQALVDAGSSIHHTDWPAELAKNGDKKLEAEMTVIREVVEKTLAQRQEAGVKVRQPLQKVVVATPYDKPSDAVLEVLKAEVNVKEVVWEKREGETTVRLDTRITPELKAEGEARDLVRSIQNLRKAAGMTLADVATVSVPEMPGAEWQKWVEQRTNSKLEKGSELKLK